MSTTSRRSDHADSFNPQVPSHRLLGRPARVRSRLAIRRPMECARMRSLTESRAHVPTPIIGTHTICRGLYEKRGPEVATSGVQGRRRYSTSPDPDRQVDLNRPHSTPTDRYRGSARTALAPLLTTSAPRREESSCKWHLSKDGACGIRTRASARLSRIRPSCRTSPDTVRRRSARTAVSKWTTTRAIAFFLRATAVLCQRRTSLALKECHAAAGPGIERRLLAPQGDDCLESPRAH
jgi:hypothetical protein